jgi:hypothetical protein
MFSALSIFLPNPPTILCDNIGTTYLTPNLTFHGRTKHIEIDFHFVYDKVASRTLVVRFLSRNEKFGRYLHRTVCITSFLSPSHQAQHRVPFVLLTGV